MGRGLLEDRLREAPEVGGHGVLHGSPGPDSVTDSEVYRKEPVSVGVASGTGPGPVEPSWRERTLGWGRLSPSAWGTGKSDFLPPVPPVPGPWAHPHPRAK